MLGKRLSPQPSSHPLLSIWVNCDKNADKTRREEEDDDNDDDDDNGVAESCWQCPWEVILMRE